MRTLLKLILPFFSLALQAQDNTGIMQPNASNLLMPRGVYDFGFRLPRVAGTPTGTPRLLNLSYWGSKGALVYDTTGSRVLVYNGTTWQPIATPFTTADARNAISLTTTGSSGPATYNAGTGVLNVPQYTLAGLGGVPTTRTLTINGTAFDLSADRSWTIATGATPAGANGQIQFNNSGALGASSNLFWSNTNNRLGIGTNAPSFDLDVITNNSIAGYQMARFRNTNPSGVSIFSLESNTNGRRVDMVIAGSSYIVPNVASIISSGRVNSFDIGTDGDISSGGNAPIRFRPGGFNAPTMLFVNRTSVGINTTTPHASAALDITSTTGTLLIPRLTTAQRDLLPSPADGGIIYNTTTSTFQGRAAGTWVNLH